MTSSAVDSPAYAGMTKICVSWGGRYRQTFFSICRIIPDIPPCNA